ncbi:hypothetical protein HK100_001708 [Physocladia obscura]|uniref:Uncharacterized protein n=1 Tax=Physocladia obscura TaxID=109957 RepID=A0AAD5T846_9FUNG|nr:hypothetical protein HK100_001708 [Physocladia obscura]
MISSALAKDEVVGSSDYNDTAETIDTENEFEVDSNHSDVDIDFHPEALLTTTQLPTETLPTPPQFGGTEGGGQLKGYIIYELKAKPSKRLHSGTCECSEEDAHIASNKMILILYYDARPSETLISVKIDEKLTRFCLDGFSGSPEHAGGALFRHSWNVKIEAVPGDKPASGNEPTAEAVNQKPLSEKVRDETNSSNLAVAASYPLSANVAFNAGHEETSSQLEEKHSIRPLLQAAEWKYTLRLHGDTPVNASDIKRYWWSWRTKNLDSPFVGMASPLPESVVFKFVNHRKGDDYKLIVTLEQNYWDISKKFLGTKLVLQRHKWIRKFNIDIPDRGRKLTSLLKNSPTGANPIQLKPVDDGDFPTLMNHLLSKIFLPMVVNAVTSLATAQQNWKLKIPILFDLQPIYQEYEDGSDAVKGCWAACIAMLMQFREKRATSITDAHRQMNDRLAAELASILWEVDAGINEHDKNKFINALDLCWIGPSSLAPWGWYELLSVHGPLWTTAEGFGTNHSRILIGYEPKAMAAVNPSTGNTSGDDLMTFLDPMYDKPITFTFSEWLPMWEREIRESSSYNNRAAA